jgi:hypothetical protein
VNTSFTEGFAAEIEKVSGLLSKAVGGAAKTTGGFLARHPFATIFGAVPAVTGASKAFAQRMSGAAGAEPSILTTKPLRPSREFYTNFHELFPHRLAPWQKYRLHRNFPAYRGKQGPLA